ncbi:MAG: hypothetical protein KC519_07320, partial [Anaerolineae bacterium]|nr:hypothetical protein [Anaerolineae bacterium]
MKAPQWTDATRALDSAARILLVTHLQPDGDAIGSLLGFGNALRARGRTVDLAVDGGVPDFVEWLTGADTAQSDSPAPRTSRAKTGTLKM